MKKYKLTIIPIFALLALYAFISIWKASTHEEVLSMYPLEKSLNKEASAQFLKAMEYRIYIKQLHPFFDYDSFVMAPLLEKIDYHFKKGKALLPKDSVEDIVWWTLFYKEIYGLLGNLKNDESLFYENLPYNKFKIKHDMIYNMIMRYPEGKVYFKIDEIEKFRFQTMAILAGFYYKVSPRRYNADTRIKRSRMEQNDINAMKSHIKVKDKYKLAYKKFINTSKKKEFMKREFFYDMISINTKIIVNYLRINKTQKLPPEICFSEDNQTIINQYVDPLIDFVKTSNTPRAKDYYYYLFKDGKHTNIPIIFKLLNYRCPNLKPKVTEVVRNINYLNKLKN